MKVNEIETALAQALRNHIPAEKIAEVCDRLTDDGGAIYTTGENSSEFILGATYAVHVDVERLLSTVGGILELIIGPDKLNAAKVLSLLATVMGIKGIARPVDDDQIKTCLILVDRGQYRDGCFRSLSLADLRTEFLLDAGEDAEKRLENSLGALKELRVVEMLTTGGRECLCLKELVITRRPAIQTLNLKT
jgi:hypothetical protein